MCSGSPLFTLTLSSPGPRPGRIEGLALSDVEGAGRTEELLRDAAR